MRFCGRMRLIMLYNRTITPKRSRTGFSRKLRSRVRRLPASPYVRVLTSDLHVQLRTRVLLDPVKIRRENLYSNSRDTSCREAGVSMVV